MLCLRVSARAFVLAWVVLLFASHVGANDLDTAWIRFYDGPSAMSDGGWSVDVDTAGFVYATGFAQAPSGLFHPIHVLTTKYNPAGDTLWLRLMLSSGSSNDQGMHIRATGNGQSVVAARRSTTELWLLKYLANGDTAWAREYAFLLDPKRLALGPADGVWVIGVSGTADWRTVHYDSNGTFQWVATYADLGVASDVPYDLAVDSSGNSYVTGMGEGIGANRDFVTIKYSATGVHTWRRRYDGYAGLSDAAIRIRLHGQDTLYVGGTSENAGGDNDIVLLKYTTDGDTVWTRRFAAPGTGPDVLIDLELDGSSNIHLAGTVYTSGSTSEKVIIKYTPSGDTAWMRSVSTIFEIRDMAVAADGTVYVIGEGLPPGAILNDWGVMKYSPAGDSIGFRWLYNGIHPVGFQTPRSLALGPDGELLACGNTSSGFGGSNNFTVAKFISGCSCNCHGDPQCDGFTNVLDVVHAVNVAFKGGAPIPDSSPSCPRTTTDVDCNGFTNVLDVVKFVNVAFKGATAASQFCNPCGP